MSLFGNPLVCSCDLKWIISYKHYLFMKGRCVQVANERREQFISVLKQADFQNCS
ncbi:Uncharacterised protein r2_g1251 [Pycnogonum litorale]